MSRKHVKEERFRIVIFISLVVVFLVFVSMLENRKESDKNQRESELIVQKLTFSSDKDVIAFIVNDQIDASRLDRISKMDYEELKKELGIEKDFYMFLEDDNGDIIPIGNKMCIGSPKVEIAGHRCG